MLCINHISLSEARKGFCSMENNFLIHSVKHPSSFKKGLHKFHVSAYQVVFFIMFVLGLSVM